MPINAQTISTAPLGTFVSGLFSDTFDVGLSEVNMVALDLVGGIRYDIDVDNGATGDLFLRVFDQFGSEVRANDDGFRNNDNVVFSLSPFIQMQVNHSGRYYVAISPYYLDDYDPFSIFGRSIGSPGLPVTAGTLQVQEAPLFFWAFAGSINSIAAESSDDLSDLLSDTDGSLRAEFLGSIGSLSDVNIARIDLYKGDTVVVDVNGALAGSTIGTVLRVFDDTGAQIAIDDDAGFGEDAELVFQAATLNDYYIAVSGEGNSAYNGLDGTGTVNAVAQGFFEVIIHRNPTQIGTSAANAINGSSNPDYIVSLAGNDFVFGNDGNDTLAGGDDQDSLSGGSGLDVLYGEHGNDTLRGDGRRDILVGGLGDDLLDGGADTDMLQGGVGNDVLLGGGGGSADTLFGGDGLDTLSGGGGEDILNGEAGQDSLLGEAQDDRLFGGADNDILRGGSGDDTLDGGTNDDQLFGDNGNDALLASTGNDTVDGGEGADSLVGDSGVDSLLGGGGNDTLLGGADGDVLEGADNQDWLTGGTGSDTLRGGGGADVFVFLSGESGTDRIEDMGVLQDRIDLSSMFAAAGSVVTAANLSEFVQLTPAGAGGDSFLAVDVNGLTGGSSFTTIALVIGVAPGVLFDANNFIL